MPAYVARYRAMAALAARRPARVVGADGALIFDRPGFEVDFLGRNSLGPEPWTTPRHEVLMVHRGHWRLAWDEGETILAPATPAPCRRDSPAASRRP